MFILYNESTYVDRSFTGCIPARELRLRMSDLLFNEVSFSITMFVTD